MKVGFTGTREGMSKPQLIAVRKLLIEYCPEELHHGVCEGADEECHGLARRLRAEVRLIGHPGVTRNGKMFWRADVFCDEVLPAKAFLERNKDIVDATNVLIAAPRGYVPQQQGGTWATIRYARSVGRPICIVWPDGSLG